MAVYCTHQAADLLIEAVTEAVLQRLAIAQETNTEPDPLMSRTEVLNELGIAASTLWTWEKKGIIIPPRKAMYRRSDVERIKVQRIKGEKL